MYLLKKIIIIKCGYGYCDSNVNKNISRQNNVYNFFYYYSKNKLIYKVYHGFEIIQFSTFSKYFTCS